jgi:hypothetical protein
MIRSGRYHVRFSWQGGYGASSVSTQSIEIVKQYIESQHEHYKTTTFQDEYRGILREHNVEFDESVTCGISNVRGTFIFRPFRAPSVGRYLLTQGSELPLLTLG